MAKRHVVSIGTAAPTLRVPDQQHASRVSSRADAVLRLQRTAGNRATVAALQRKPAAPDVLAPEVRRASGPEGTAAIIWRSSGGVIEALVELDGNPSLDAYLTGGATLDQLVADGRAMWAQQSLSALPRPEATHPTATRNPGAGTSPATPLGQANRDRATSAEVKQDRAKRSQTTNSALGEWSAQLAKVFKMLRTARLLLFMAGSDLMRNAAATEAQLRLLRRRAAALTNRLAKSGGGPRVAAQLKAVESEITAARSRIAAGKEALREANALVRGEVQAASGLFARIRQLLSGAGVVRQSAKGVVWRNLWKAVGPRFARLRNLLQKSGSVSKLFAAMRVLGKPWVSRTLIGLSAALDAVNAYTTSRNTSQAGKLADAGMTGASGALVVANPVTAIADVLLPKQYKLSTMYRGGSGAVFVELLLGSTQF